MMIKSSIFTLGLTLPAFLVVTVLLVAGAVVSEAEEIPEDADDDVVDVWKDSVHCNSESGKLEFKTEIFEKFSHCELKLKDSQKHAHCVYFCLSRAMGLLTPEGLPDPKLYEEFVRKVFPTKYHEKINKDIDTCFQKYADKIDPNDDACVGVGTFGHCVGKAMTLEC